MITIVLILTSMLMFMLAMTGSGVNATIAIIVSAVIIGGMVLVIVGFLSYHLYLMCTGKTTREHLKRVGNSATAQLSDYNWCHTDASLIDFSQLLDDHSET